MKFISLSLAALAATASAQVKVMLLGDSITEITCWRPLVWEQLTSAGIAGNVDFVGSMNDLQGCSAPSGFDRDHEGHSGWQVYDIARNNIAGWVQNTKPDIVQFMLGTNDVNIGKRDATSILGSFELLITAIRNANPNAKIIVDKLIPTSWSDATVEAVNTALPNWVAQHTTTESPIAIADCSRAAGFTNAMLRSDGVHPNDQGDQFIAKAVGPQLITFINDVLGASASSGGSTSRRNRRRL
ncbi:NAD(P)H-quinone oxidoreductase subunit N [Dichotomopilus funicola]|uniref:NAD(P)H-quinone oxidoreductase subunit N n=1 Tax=Dichotomopilus funicola TaxID=1934379 RepID=A0AAN6ZKH1_9PEZI|nr:NAD(P)H-quinone oxidoreductase subunit N [Dichotomopilus funicola]